MENTFVSKIEKSLKLLKSIQEKKEFILDQTEYLNKFNLRLKILLKCFECYSFDGSLVTEGLYPALKSTFKSSTPNKNDVTTKLVNEKLVKKFYSPNANFDSKDILFEKIKYLFTNSFEREVALNIYKLVDSKQVSLTELVKQMKINRYKLVDILNVLIKERIIIKYFDKEFHYKINK